MAIETTKKIQINYDLKSPDGNYSKVEEYIKSYDAWDHLLESCWVVKTQKTAAQVRDDLNAIVHKADRVAVFDVTTSAWSTNFSDKRTEWLKAA